MGPGLQPNQSSENRDAAVAALLFRPPAGPPEAARVDATQQLLFPTGPRAVCEDLGLNWWAALKLHEDGWLSFPPEHTQRLNEAQEAELRFVGSLVVTGCDRNMLQVLLRDLPRPYAYDLKRMFYDWLSHRWRGLPESQWDPEAVFADWLEMLVHKRDATSLHGIGELAHDALMRVEGGAPAKPFPPRHWSVTSDGESTQG